MKILICQNPKCNGRKQATGKFCLDCGQPLKEIITSSVIFNKMKTSKSAEGLKTDIRRWLVRIGVQNPDIQIVSNGTEAIVEYTLGKSRYKFSSHMQENLTTNLAAVEQFLHYRVIGIERGIETTEQAFAGYEALPDFTASENPYDILGIPKTASVDEARNRFREIAKKCHPDVDKSETASARFQRIKKAIDEIEAKR